jgi:hypothetical protein
MSFSLIDLVKANITYKNVQLISNFDFELPFHILMHHGRNRVITVSKYKKTVKLLSNLYELQPNYNIQNKDISVVLASNISLTYNVELTNSSTAAIRTAIEKVFISASAKRTSLEKTWDEPNALSHQTVTALRLKAAALDHVYDTVNCARSSMISDIVLDEYIYNNRYMQALSYLENKNNNISLLKIYADHLNVDILTAANHCIFCYEEDQMKIAESELDLSKTEKSILESTNLLELQEIAAQWQKKYEFYL